MSKKTKRITISLITVLLLLVSARIYLPYWVTDYINKALDNVPGYQGSIEDVDINLYRGAYKIRYLKMDKIQGDIPVPFVDVELIDLSVQWKALLHGELVGEIELFNAELNFASDSSNKQTGTEADWTKPIKELMPLQINRFAVTNGKIAYKDFSTNPKVDLYVKDVKLEALNLRNVEGRDGTLPSTIEVSGISIGDGELSLSCNANLMKETPDFDLTMEFEEVDVTALNEFANAYANLDFERGDFNLYAEMAASNGALEGYVKPIFNDLKVFSLKDDTGGPLEVVWEGIAGFFTTVFKNYPRDQFATEVPFSGDISDPETKIWPTIGGIFKNAFIKGFSKDTEGAVSFEDVVDS